jgi:hypothetical protein
LAAVVTGTWTAFETLAESIWETALNEHPQGLAALDGVAGKNRKRGDEPKSLPLPILQKYRYDLSSHMGTILKDRYPFDRLEGIQRAYSDAAFEDDQKILGLILRSELQVLAAIRNALIHNGGIIDEEYLKHRKILPSPAVGAVGTPIALDGEIVAAVVIPVVQIAGQLIAVIDDWLSSRKK